MSDEPTPMLHLYAQPFWHAEAYIVGDREGLTALRDAIDAALDTGRGTASPFASDGEGYELEVLAVSTEDAWRLGVPYTDEMALDKRKGNGVLWPYQISSSNNQIQRAR